VVKLGQNKLVAVFRTEYLSKFRRDIQSSLLIDIDVICAYEPYKHSFLPTFSHFFPLFNKIYGITPHLSSKKVSFLLYFLSLLEKKERGV